MSSDAETRPALSPRTRAEDVRHSWWLWLALEIPLLCLAGWRNFDNIFYDTVAYLRIARYYAEGRLDLAINGYWGPLLSWLMAPLLAITHDHLLTTRLVMGASGLAFFCAGIRLLRSLDLPPGGPTLAAALLVPFSVCWSVARATPDLLMASLVLVGLAETLARHPNGAGRRPLLAGLAYGAAYLAKSVALPTTLGLVGALALVRWLTGAAPGRAIARSAAWCVCGIAVMVAPWVLVLSLHYGAPTISTSAAIAHAVVGPGNPDRFHPLHHVFQTPEPGRITTWEDPGGMRYSYWSPFGSTDALRYQVALAAQNAIDVATRVGGFDWLRLGLVSALAGFLLLARPGRALRDQRWRFAAPVIAVAAAPYVASYPSETRYYLIVYPLLLAAVTGFLLQDVVDGQAATGPVRSRLRAVAAALIIGSFVVGLRHELADALAGETDPAYRTARALAPVLTATGEPGALISVDDQSVAYFAAYLLDWPFYGDKIVPTQPDEVAGTGARFLVTRRATPFAQALERQRPAFLQPLPTPLRAPVAVYRIDTPERADQRR